MNERITPMEIRIQDYLDQVSAVLLDDRLSVEDTESVCDGLRAQIYDMAGQDGDVSEESIARSIESMEDPVNFRNSTTLGSVRSQTVRVHAAERDASQVLATIGFNFAISGPVIAIISGLIASFMHGEGWEFGSFILFAVAIIALIFGVIAFKQPKGRAAIMVAIGTIVGYFVLVLVALLFE